jgi:hypothetical protein
MGGAFCCPPAGPATVIALAMLAPTTRKTMLKMMQRGGYRPYLELLDT